MPKEQLSELEKKAISLERRVDQANKEIRILEEKKKKESAHKNFQVAKELSGKQQELSNRERICRDWEERLDRRSANLDANSVKYLRLEEEKKTLREKAIAVETRALEVKKLNTKAVNLDSEGQDKLARAIQKEKELRAKEQEVANQIQLFSVKKDELSVAQDDFYKMRESYNLIKEEIEPKLSKQKEQEQLLRDLEDKVNKKEAGISARETELNKSREYLMVQNKALEDKEVALREKEIDINEKIVRHKIEA